MARGLREEIAAEIYDEVLHRMPFMPGRKYAELNKGSLAQKIPLKCASIAIRHVRTWDAEQKTAESEPTR